MTSKLVMMALVLSSASLSMAAAGDITTKNVTKRTGRSVILDVGECLLLPKTTVDGKTYMESQVEYVTCDEVVSYDVDVLDKGYWREEQMNARNQVYSTRTSIERITKSTYWQTMNKDMQSTGNAATDILVQVGSTGLDAAKVQNECLAAKQSLLFQARQNDAKLLSACGK